jgi:Flp pilus assembly protein TadG
MVSGGIIHAVAKRAGRQLRRLLFDRSGVAAVEFAILLPIMIGLYIGGLEFSDGFTVKRKVTNATSALGDLVTRTEEITKAEMADILEAASAVIAPYDVGNLKIKVSGVAIDEDSVAKVTWGAAQNDTALAKDATMTLPDGVKIPETFLVVVEVHYNFDPVIGYVITGSIDISDTFYLKPRLSDTICYDTTCT